MESFLKKNKLLGTKKLSHEEEKKCLLKLVNNYADSHNAMQTEIDKLKLEIFSLKSTLKINKEIIKGVYEKDSEVLMNFDELVDNEEVLLSEKQKTHRKNDDKETNIETCINSTNYLDIDFKKDQSPKHNEERIRVKSYAKSSNIIKQEVSEYNGTNNSKNRNINKNFEMNLYITKLKEEINRLNNDYEKLNNEFEKEINKRKIMSIMKKMKFLN